MLQSLQRLSHYAPGSFHFFRVLLPHSFSISSLLALNVQCCTFRHLSWYCATLQRICPQTDWILPSSLHKSEAYGRLVLTKYVKDQRRTCVEQAAHSKAWIWKSRLSWIPSDQRSAVKSNLLAWAISFRGQLYWRNKPFNSIRTQPVFNSSRNGWVWSTVSCSTVWRITLSISSNTKDPEKGLEWRPSISASITEWITSV